MMESVWKVPYFPRLIVLHEALYQPKTLSKRGKVGCRAYNVRSFGFVDLRIRYYLFDFDRVGR